MPPIKDSDTLTAPETTARSGSASTSSTESAVKAQPVALEIPITVNGARTVEGSDKREPFSESTKTVMVFGSGAVIRLTSAVAPGQLLFLTNERTKKEVVCQVVKSKNYRNVSGYVELEFTEPAVGFWGMRFPGDRIGSGPQAAATDARTPATGNGAPAPAPAHPAATKTEQLAASSASSVNAAKPSAPAALVSKPAAPATASSSSSIVPPAMDSAALLGNSKTKTNASVPAAPIATSLEADTPLVEPWLKKREPAPRVPAAPPSVAPPAPPVKTAETEASLTPVRDFASERPSDKPASLFAPAEAPASLAGVDLSSLAPFFEVKPSPADVPVATPPKAPAASDPEAEELKQQTARLQDELAKMQFAEAASSSTVRLGADKPETEKPVLPEMETPSFPLTEQSIATLKTELVHESAARLVENAEPSNATPVLPEMSQLKEPSKVEPPTAVIPALESLEQEEMKIPAWLEPLARNSSTPSSTQELVLREKAKRRAEYPPLPDSVAAPMSPEEEKGADESRVPQFGSTLPFEERKSAGEASRKGSGKGMMVGMIAAGILALAGGGWWYMNQQLGGIHGSVPVSQAAVASPAPQDLQANTAKEAVLGSVLPGHADPAASQSKPAEADSNAPSNPTNTVSSSNSAGSAAGAARGPQVNSSGWNGGNDVAKAEAGEPEAVHVVEKKPVLGEIHLSAPKISQKRTAQTGAEPDAAIMSEEQPGTDANALGAGLAVANNQPAAPEAPVAVGGDVKQAKLISSVPPVYPTLAKAQHVTGGVTIDALIDASGRVTMMNVISGPALLQQAAMDALKQWKYQPATLDGKAVPMHLSVTIQFRLQQ